MTLFFAIYTFDNDVVQTDFFSTKGKSNETVLEMNG